MPVFNKSMVFELARGVRAYLSLELGITRRKAPAEKPHGVAGWSARGNSDRPRKIAELERKLAARDREMARLRARMGETSEPYPDRISPDRLIWIFGTARVGSTWLGAMMQDLPDHSVWHEPIVGELFGQFYYSRIEGRRGRHSIMGERYKESWLEFIRFFVLEGADIRFPERSETGYLVVKEPNGSIGAPLLMEALPESKMILLVRDPRDVVSSSLDAYRKDGWLSGRRDGQAERRTTLSERDPNALVRSISNKYLQYVGNSMLAFEAHGGPKILIRYEELRARTLDEMERIYATLGVPVDERKLARAVEKHSWKNIPQEKKGGGKFFRKGEPGGWREDLTSEQIEIVERTTAPLLEQFYPGTKSRSAARTGFPEGTPPLEDADE